MKHFCLFLSVLFVNTLYAQIPNGYYSKAEGVSGQELKDSLYQIIKNHTEYPYTSTGTDVWDILKESDKDSNNPNNVILFYSGWSVNAGQEYNSGAGWSREHVWAKSRGNFGTSKGAGTDAHHLRPADVSINSARNNRWFHWGETEYLDGGVPTQNFTSNYHWVWEPRDEVKGDVARMLFYMATRYEGENGEPDLELVDIIPSDKYTQEPIHAVLSTLLAWHEMDPVDAFEQNRNEVVYSYQQNRNPFIDFPTWVNDIFTIDTSGTSLPTVPKNISFSRLSKTEVSLRWDLTPNNIAKGYEIYLDNNLVTTVSRNQVDLVGLTPSTTYHFEVRAMNYSNVVSNAKDTFFVTLSDVVGLQKQHQQQLVVAPNPFTNNVQMQHLPVGCYYEISNVLGNLIAQGEVVTSTVNITTTQWKPGLYHLKVYNKQGEEAIYRLLKTR
jgi:endonuclease I